MSSEVMQGLAMAYADKSVEDIMVEIESLGLDLEAPDVVAQYLFALGHGSIL